MLKRTALAAAAVAVTSTASLAQGLPAGDGKDLVEGVCTACHQTVEIQRSSGYTREGWTELISSMIDLSSAKPERDRIIDYLANHFPPNTTRAPKPMPGSTQIAFKEWKVPTLGQRARDPVEGPDGRIWFAGQFGNVVGWIDPKTSEMKEYPLPAKSLPHTVVLDAKGDVWFTGNANGTMGRLDPKTGEIKVYPMPDPTARDPHTAIFDADGIMWFTAQQSNFIGRLDPATGEIKLVKSPVANAKPYGIKVDAQGTLWVACNGAACLLKVDPKTMAITEIKLPTPGTTVRRLDVAADGTIWYVNSGKGKLGHYDPKTGAIREWESPSGARSHPYAIAVVDGIVWYNESGMRPDMLVRFDPASETFQSWPIPSGGIYAGILRHMRPTRDGNLLIHQSSTNRIILVTPLKRQAMAR